MSPDYTEPELAKGLKRVKIYSQVRFLEKKDI
jgi:hypothetical protein